MKKTDTKLLKKNKIIGVIQEEKRQNNNNDNNVFITIIGVNTEEKERSGK